MNLKHTIGIEFTYIPPPQKLAIYYFSRIRRKLYELGTCKRISNDYYDIGVDCGNTIEISSKETKSLKKIERIYKQTLAAALATNCTTHSDDEISGGGHIHININSIYLKHKICADQSKRPYVAWAFNDPCDTDISPLPLGIDNEDDCHRNTSKLYHIKYNSDFDTIEFRMFDMASNWEIQKLHILYVHHYIEWIKRNNITEDVPNFNRTSMLTHFKKHIEEIGLNWDDYKQFVVNIKDRFEYGKEHIDWYFTINNITGRLRLITNTKRALNFINIDRVMREF